ncbi:MAG: HD family phosphohydrolase, partial [Pirellulales bacterium]
VAAQHARVCAHPVPLEQLQATLQLDIDKVIAAETLDDLEPGTWQRFEPVRDDKTPPSDPQRQQAFQQFRKLLAEEGALEKFRKAVTEALTPFEQRGLLRELPSEHVGNKEKIFVHLRDKPDFPEEIAIRDVLIASARPAIKKNLLDKLVSVKLADRVFNWLQPQLPSTLSLDPDATRGEQERAVTAVPRQKQPYPAGSLLAKAGVPLDAAPMTLLRLEHQERLARRPLPAKIGRFLAFLGMCTALYTLCGFCVYNREPTLLSNLPRFFTMLCLVVLTVALSTVMSRDAWRAELVPLLLFGMTVTIAYQQELALLLAAVLTLLVAVSIGCGLAGAVVLLAAATGAILTLRRIRNRSKLLLVGLYAGGVALLTTLGIGTLFDQPLYPELFFNAIRLSVWAIIAGSLMTCLLPFIERFGVQTELSLIELGDPAHPLLQELVRRAPGTYNHSITVASLAEAAAESIGARGLLVRVGAYYHDIGKMLKPGYFIENQGKGDNRHESLVPAMSTLVIIAHVKDGAAKARQHHLPEAIIDFIQQHHGTTLVEYFYRRASEQQEAKADGSEVDESSFRYPGPKPQTKEAGILMLADGVESASRVLVDPTPSRIESLVSEITMKRLMDGQFDDCGLTLKEVHAVGESLVKSLTAVYHGRVKYPDMQTA